MIIIIILQPSVSGSSTYSAIKYHNPPADQRARSCDGPRGAVRVRRPIGSREVLYCTCSGPGCYKNKHRIWLSSCLSLPLPSFLWIVGRCNSSYKKSYENVLYPCTNPTLRTTCTCTCTCTRGKSFLRRSHNDAKTPRLKYFVQYKYQAAIVQVLLYSKSTPVRTRSYSTTLYCGWV